MSGPENSSIETPRWEMVDHNDRFNSWIIYKDDPANASMALYLPPYSILPDTRDEWVRYEASLRSERDTHYPSSWAKAIYEHVSEDDPDSYEFPVLIQQVTLEEVIAEVPEAFHEKVRENMLTYIKRLRAGAAGRQYSELFEPYKAMVAQFIDAFELREGEEFPRVNPKSKELLDEIDKSIPKANIDDIK